MGYCISVPFVLKLMERAPYHLGDLPGLRGDRGEHRHPTERGLPGRLGAGVSDHAG